VLVKSCDKATGDDTETYMIRYFFSHQVFIRNVCLQNWQVARCRKCADERRNGQF
jgi:hypothetical protein